MEVDRFAAQTSTAGGPLESLACERGQQRLEDEQQALSVAGRHDPELHSRLDRYIQEERDKLKNASEEADPEKFCRLKDHEARSYASYPPGTAVPVNYRGGRGAGR